jgi:translation initiation factor 3 subunit B
VRPGAAIAARISFPTFSSRYKVRLEDGFDHILVVDGVPTIDKSKLEKLLVKIAKEFTRKGAAIKPGDISMPWNDRTGKSQG